LAINTLISFFSIFLASEPNEKQESINITEARIINAIKHVASEITTEYVGKAPLSVRRPEQPQTQSEAELPNRVKTVLDQDTQAEVTACLEYLLSKVKSEPISKSEELEEDVKRGASVVVLPDANRGTTVGMTNAIQDVFFHGTESEEDISRLPQLSKDLERRRSVSKESNIILTASCREVQTGWVDGQSEQTSVRSYYDRCSVVTLVHVVPSKDSNITLTATCVDIEAGWHEGEIEHTPVKSYRIQSTSASTTNTARSSTQVHLPVPDIDCVLEDVESFDKEMRHIQEQISEIGSSEKESKSEDAQASTRHEPRSYDSVTENTSSRKAISTNGRDQYVGQLDQGSASSVTDSKDSTNEETLAGQDNTSQEQSFSADSMNSIDIATAEDVSAMPLAYRRRLKLKHALNDLPTSEEHLYNAVIAVEMTEAEKGSACASVADEANETARPQQADSDPQTSRSDRHEDFAQRIREAVDKMAKNIETQTAPGASEEKELTAEQLEARKLKNDYGYPPPKELGPNPPEIKSYSERRSHKIQLKLRNIHYEPCPRSDHENWTDTLFSGQRVKYVRYTESEHVIKIGYGSFGDVYLGMLDESKLVVIKLFKSGKSDLETIAKEAIITQLLSGTKCTPKYLGLIAFPETEAYVRLGLVLEYIGDRHLNAKYSRFFEVFRSEVRRIDHERRALVPVHDWLRICYKLADGLGKIHEKGIIVNDLKCDNLLLNFDGRHYNPYVIDFGISKLVNDQEVYQIPISEDKWEVFSEHYAHVAPEIYKGGHATLKSDVFSLGAILLTIDGIFHFKVRNIANLCRQTDPEKRPTARELAAMLRNIMKLHA
jgi:hypothetical protein